MSGVAVRGLEEVEFVYREADLGGELHEGERCFGGWRRPGEGRTLDGISVECHHLFVFEQDNLRSVVGSRTGTS